MRRTSKSLFCSLVLILCCTFLIRQPSAGKSQAEVWQKVLSLEGQDLTKLDTQIHKELFQFLKSVAPAVNEIQMLNLVVGGPPYKPPFHGLRYIWKIEKPNAPIRYIVVGASPLIIIPGDSRAEAFVFDEEGKLLSYSEFSLGWREQFKDVNLKRNNSLNIPLIEFRTNYSDGGADQYLALVDDHLALIHLESKGIPARNLFVATNWTKGPEMPQRTAEEWEQALLSDDPVELLRTLMWIGGKHWDLKNYPPQQSDWEVSTMPDVVKNAELVVAVRARYGVRQRLQELRHSQTQWIREAAEFAIKPHDGDTSICCGYSSQ